MSDELCARSNIRNADKRHPIPQITLSGWGCNLKGGEYDSLHASRTYQRCKQQLSLASIRIYLCEKDWFVVKASAAIIAAGSYLKKTIAYCAVFEPPGLQAA